MIKYQTDPLKIREESAKEIKRQLSLDYLTTLEKEIAIQMIQACGDLTILDNLRFSESAAEICMKVLDDDYDLLCDTESVACAIKAKYLKDEPICLISKANVISQAKAKKHTRSMTAIDLWRPYLANSVVLIGEEPTALFRLLEILEELNNEDAEKYADKKPALIIATPAGFLGAKEIKDYLWDKAEKIGIPCITLLGTKGGSILSATALNTLLKQHDINKEHTKK